MLSDRRLSRLFSLRALPSAGKLALVPAALLLAACATTTISPPEAGTSPRPAEQVARPAAPAVPTQEELSLKSLVAFQDRLYRVAAPLIINNSELCKANARNLLGFTAKNRFSYSPEYVGAAQKALGLGDRLQIMGVLDGSGAARAGVRPGDGIVAVEGQRLPEGENAERQAATILAPIVTGRSNVKLSLLREGGEVTVNVPLTFACAYGFELGNTDNVNAYSDGHRVLVTRGMMNFARTDDELAYVLAKEMAHNALSHSARQRTSATVGGVIDNLTRIRPDMSMMNGLAGIKPMPQDLDAMADKLAMYLLARANYRIDGAVPFWRRLATQYPPSTLNAYTALHPSTNYRISIMERTLKDVRAKQAAKKPIMP
ncbi:M48 family metallopeptidase [Noviherbaspirillum aerium]|uniref:M48 family metallopeptidase n=1 Tax=Noviherbaspirillum aerium TaxID=2588497 RepID=UPI00124D0A1A|nr:M48 family metallopeptidase [Noviherbaspirillum aerium]